MITRSTRCLASPKVRSSHCNWLPPNPPLKGTHLGESVDHYQDNISHLVQPGPRAQEIERDLVSHFNGRVVPLLHASETLEEVDLRQCLQKDI